MIEYVIGYASVTAAFHVTSGVAIVVEFVLDRANFAANVTIGIAIVIIGVLGTAILFCEISHHSGERIHIAFVEGSDIVLRFHSEVELFGGHRFPTLGDNGSNVFMANQSTNINSANSFIVFYFMPATFGNSAVHQALQHAVVAFTLIVGPTGLEAGTARVAGGTADLPQELSILGSIEAKGNLIKGVKCRRQSEVTGATARLASSQTGYRMVTTHQSELLIGKFCFNLFGKFAICYIITGRGIEKSSDLLFVNAVKGIDQLLVSFAVHDVVDISHSGIKRIHIATVSGEIQRIGSRQDLFVGHSVDAFRSGDIHFLHADHRTIAKVGGVLSPAAFFT